MKERKKERGKQKREKKRDDECVCVCGACECVCRVFLAKKERVDGLVVWWMRVCKVAVDVLHFLFLLFVCLFWTSMCKGCGVNNNKNKKNNKKQC